MNRRLTALFAALEAVLAAGLGLGILLVPATAMWAFHYDLQIDWTVFYRASADLWLLGHGVDLHVDMAIPGIADGSQAFTVTMGLLGLGLLTALLGARSGRRVLETDHPGVALPVTVVVFAALAAVVSMTAGSPLARPSEWQGIVLPTLIFSAGIALGAAIPSPDARRRPAASVAGPLIRARDAVADVLPDAAGAVLAGAARLGGMVVGGVVAVAALLVAVLLVAGYATVITLYESLQAGVLGGAALTVAQLALLPNLIIWTVAWLVGPGFAIGAGSSVSPLGTSLGPIPSLPVFGAIPTGETPFGFVGLAVPVVLAFLAGALLRPRIADEFPGGGPGTGPALGIGALAGLLAGVVFGVLTWLASGSAGPGRLEAVGADPLLVGALAAVEVAVGAMLGLAVAGRSPAPTETAAEPAEASR